MAEVEAQDLGKVDVRESVEITPEMIEAGTVALWASGRVEEQLGSDGLLVSEIFRAMQDHRSAQTNSR